MTTETSDVAVKLGELKKALDEEGVEVDNLGVCMVGDEQFVGSIVQETYREGGIQVKLRNPKRLLRLQQVQPGNFRIDFLLIDLDLISSGEIEVYASGFYRLAEQSQDTQLRMLALYAQYLESKKVARAAAAGIQLPRMQTPQGIGGKVRPTG